ncbi:MAG: AAA family ATPase [Clostridia bacterium]|nr:AAA family ATPase [Clostridia bacterium]
MIADTNASAFFNMGAERSILGSALNDSDSVRPVADMETDAFYDAKHKLIHAAVRSLAAQKKNVDLLSVDEWLTLNGQSDKAGGTAYLVDLTQSVVSSAGLRSHIQIVKECAMRRSLYLIGKELQKRAEGESPDETREWAARTVRELRSGSGMKLISMREAVMSTYNRLGDEQQTGEDEPTRRIMSGIPALDERLGGLRGGEYVAIGARPSVGKSILALTFCVNAARQGKRVLLCSLEMSDVEITERVLANEGDVPLNVITSGKITPEGWTGIAKAIGPVSELPLWYCLEASTVEKVRRAAYQVYESGGLDMIAIDYLQLMEATYSRKQNRQEQISEISRGLRLLAQELQIPIIVLTQLNRASVKERVQGKTVRREPTMSEARESGAIEQDANIFLLLHDPARDEMQSDYEREVWDALHKKGLTMMRVIIDKNRQGKRGRLTAAFDGDHMRFLPIPKREEGED